MACVATSPIGELLLNPETEAQLSEALTSYEAACQQTGNPVTIDLESILQATPTATTSMTSTTASATDTDTDTETETTSIPDGAGKTAVTTGALFGAFAVVAASLF